MREIFLARLALCQTDFAADFLAETAEDIKTTLGKEMSREQIRKFILKAVRPLITLLAPEPPLPGGRSTAFVAMSFEKPQLRRYENAIAPTLLEVGFTPVMMREQPVSLAVTLATLKCIADCSLMVVDLTHQSANVFMEAGAAFLRRVRTIYIAHGTKNTYSTLPFMIRNENIYFYSSDENLRSELKRAVRIVPEPVPLPDC
jgi:hypothetical protein